MANTERKTKGKVPANFHGVKGRSGRKKAAATLLKEDFLKQQEGTARDAFAYHVQVMNDPNEDTDMRLAAAKEIMRRVWGEKTEVKQSGGLVIRVIRGDSDTAAGPAPGADDD